MAVSTLVEILQIHTEQDLLKAVAEFEQSIDITLKPLRDKLKQQVLTPEVQQIEMHMTFVESWRDRAARVLMLASALEQHGKSYDFLLPSGKNITATDREAYQRKLTKSANSLASYLEQLLKSIDSRVNMCKKLLGNEEVGASNRRFV